MAVPDIGTVCWLPIEAAMVPESESKPTRLINLAVKQTGKPTAGNPHGGFDAAGIGNGLRFGFQGTYLQPLVNQCFMRQAYARWGQVRSPVVWLVV